MINTRVKIDRRAFFSILAQLYILLINVGFTMYGSDQLTKLSIFSFFNTIAVMVFLFIVGGKVFSVYTMFMLFLAVFHFGQAWLFGFGGVVDTNISYDIFSLYPESELYHILLFSLLAYNLIAFFLLCSLCKKDGQQVLQEKQSVEEMEYDRQNVLKFGKLFFTILLIPVSIYDYLIVTISAVYGHLGLYENSAKLSTWAAANSYFPLAIIIVLLASDPKKNGWKWMHYYAIIRCLLLMLLTGKRGSFVIPLIIYFYCRHTFIQKYKKKHIVWIALGTILLLTGLSFIAYGRGDYSSLNFTEFLFGKNIITQTLSEFGSTFTTTILSYRYTLAHGFLNGKSYLGALSVFLPFSDYIASNLKEYFSIATILNPYSPSGGALGGSLFGELYINFGYYALLLSPLIAWAVGKIEKVIQNRSKYKLFYICCSIYITYGFWIWVRGNFVDVVFVSKRILYVWILYNVYILVFRRKSVNEAKNINCI